LTRTDRFIKTIEWRDGKVSFVDQTRLPFEEIQRETDDYRVLGEAIRSLQIRGAPAIGVAAGYGVLLAVNALPSRSLRAIQSACTEAIRLLSGTRPTAVNLFTALDRMQAVVDGYSGSDPDELRELLHREAGQIAEEDRQACLAIGEHGASLLKPGSVVLTHCNAGALATAGQGTALGVITTAARQGKIQRVYVDETRPLLQGARLTTWELMREEIPVSLMTDSSAGIAMAQGRINAVIVGADRIARNGDAANKVGTYPLALMADRHGIPFYVAAPVSTVDTGTVNGAEIPIEERDGSEVTQIAGQQIAPPGVGVFAPAFDVTPNELISAIVTERGIAHSPVSETLMDVLRRRDPGPGT
jgi:methylthioribose-1-phosphate isomerase